nr:hypothetical protein [Rhodoplanes serenus]
MSFPWHLLERDHRNFFTQDSLDKLMRAHFDLVEFFRICLHILNGTAFNGSLAVVARKWQLTILKYLESQPLEPKRTTAVPEETRISLFNQATFQLGEIVVEKQNAPRLVVAQERPNSIKLIPRSIFVNDPLPRVLERSEHVVEVNQDSRGESRQYLEQLHAYITACPQNMRRVYEQNISVLQDVKCI